MKKNLFALTVVALAAMLAASPAMAKTGKKNSSSPQVIYTGEIGKKIIGYQGATPLNITIANGKITAIEALANDETPAYFAKAKEKVFKQFIGKTVSEALALDADCATGATYSSEALIKNIKLGLKQASEKENSVSPSQKAAEKKQKAAKKVMQKTGKKRMTR